MEKRLRKQPARHLKQEGRLTRRSMSASKSLNKSLEKTECICTKVCDCQNPPPDDWDGKSGCWHVSNMCPIHNDKPEPDEDCPVCNTPREITFTYAMTSMGIMVLPRN